MAGSNAAAQANQQGAESPAGDMDLAQQAAALLRKREAQRRIKLHDHTPEDFTPGKLSEAVVMAGDKTPDMRFAENQVKFKADPSKRVDGTTADRRFLENRPDILQISLTRQQNKAGVVFEDDLEEAQA